MAPPEFRPDRILATLVEYGVDFVLIGGLAAAAHTAPYPTYDVDVVPASDEPNLTRLSLALTALDARVRAGGVEGGVAFACDATSLAAVGVWNVRTRFGALDLSFVPSGTTGFPDLRRQARTTRVFGVAIRLAALEDVIRSKEAAGRDKDRLVLPVLREILANRDTGTR